MEEAVYILGIGRNTVTIIDLAEDCGYRIKGLLHYNHERTGEEYFGHRIVGCFEDILARDSVEGISFVLSMGDVRIRKSIFDRIISKGGRVPTLIHPSCVVSPRSRIGRGVQIMPGSIVQGDSSIGDNTVVTVNSVIAHSVKVGPHCLISGNVMVGAYSEIGPLTHIGQGATVVSGKVGHIGEGCVLGAGALLTKDMPSGAVYVGNPARELRKVD